MPHNHFNLLFPSNVAAMDPFRPLPKFNYEVIDNGAADYLLTRSLKMVSMTLDEVDRIRRAMRDLDVTNARIRNYIDYLQGQIAIQENSKLRLEDKLIECGKKLEEALFENRRVAEEKLTIHERCGETTGKATSMYVCDLPAEDRLNLQEKYFREEEEAVSKLWKDYWTSSQKRWDTNKTRSSEYMENLDLKLRNEARIRETGLRKKYETLQRALRGNPSGLQC